MARVPPWPAWLAVPNPNPNPNTYPNPNPGPAESLALHCTTRSAAEVVAFMRHEEARATKRALTLTLPKP